MGARAVVLGPAEQLVDQPGDPADDVRDVVAAAGLPIGARAGGALRGMRRTVGRLIDRVKN
ncbi:hypothetical protein IMZ11_03380 [Microtetraspora sp. AC03309]|uniref:hypothetical protein n=1 Tax=Microtetraspora sp. AC03309 TaxID=2779376 RepID=UPI001E45B4C6|nr:hypothetical protein [Microtetraspora sp. AC03309]MCC5574678.1 hypothetical protein [Microtetraspora sp. AC03309]